jgi:hypothetical protein
MPDPIEPSSITEPIVLPEAPNTYDWNAPYFTPEKELEALNQTGNAGVYQDENGLWRKGSPKTKEVPLTSQKLQGK